MSKGDYEPYEIELLEKISKLEEELDFYKTGNNVLQEEINELRESVAFYKNLADGEGDD